MRLFSAVGIVLWLIPNLISARPLLAQDKNPDRWEKDIAAVEERIASGESPQNAVLFVGSSSIRLWKLEESFPDLKTANHGFGGSQLVDSVNYFERIVTPVKPSIIVLYAGDNDIALGKSSQTVCHDFQAFVEKVEQQLPDCRKVCCLAIKPSTSRWALADKQQDANTLIRKVCESNPRLVFVDIWTPMLDSDGKPRADLFVKDGLHLNSEGYKVWTEALRLHLEAETNTP